MGSLNLDDFANQISKACSSYWLRSIPRIRECLETLGISNDEVVPILTRSLEHARHHQRGRAVNWLATAFLLDQGKTLNWLKRNGLLRASIYDFNGTMPRFLAQEILDHAGSLKLSNESRSFLFRNLVLLTIASGARNEFKDLMALIRHESLTLLRSCLATLNLMFMRDSFSDLEFNLNWYSGQGKEQGHKETLAEGFSFLWSHAHHRFGITELNASLWDIGGICKGRYYEILKRAAALRQFTAIEVLVNSFNYRCKKNENGVVTVSAPSPEVEKGIRLGYIDNEMQRNRLKIESEQLGAARIKEVGQILHSFMTKEGLIRLMKTPIARVQFKYPLIPELLKALSDAGYTKEELPGAEESEEKYGLTPADTMKYAVGKHLTLHDIRMVMRLSTVLATCTAIELSRRREQQDVVVNSAVATLRNNDSLDTLLGMALKPEAAKEFRDLFRWPPNSDGLPSHFDIQYRPLICTGHEWQLPMFIFSSSDLQRAALMLTRQRPAAGKNLIENQLVRTFREAGHRAEPRIKLRSRGNVVGEIDVAALIDDTLLILECKDPLLPCSMFELRTSLDHCEKAATQLDRNLAVLGQTSRRENVLSRLGAIGQSVNHVATGIVAGNRLFTGWRVGAHLVTSPGHLTNLIRSGEISIMEKTARMRDPGRLSGGAIREFFEGNFYQRTFKAMIPVKEVTELGNRRLELDSYALELGELCRQFGIDLTPSEIEKWTKIVSRPENTNNT